METNENRGGSEVSEARAIQDNEQLRMKLEAAERALTECRNGHDLYRADTEARMAQFVRERDEARAAWRCFHCGFETTDRAEAAGHFGDRDDEHAICVTWNSLNADGKLAEWQATWGQLLELQGENSRLRHKIEGLEYLLGSQEADIAQKFKGARGLTEAWQKFDSMEGRALAAEQRRDEARAEVKTLRNAAVELDEKNERLAAQAARLREALEQYHTVYEDSNIAHRWFATHFGELMNGRDFAVKCPMATEALEAIRAEAGREARREMAEIVAKLAPELCAHTRDAADIRKRNEEKEGK